MAKFNVPSKQIALRNFLTLIQKNYVHDSDLLKTLEEVTYDEYNLFYKEMVLKAKILSFIHGDTDLRHSSQIIESSIISNFPRLDKEKGSPYFRNPHANLLGYFVFREALLKKFNVDNAIINFYQIGRDDYRNYSLAKMIRQISGYIYFTQLRIREQLGYTTKGRLYSKSNMLV